MRYIVTNFAYGYGPFLRTTELALALNDIRRERGEEEFGIIVPWVYGERQKKLMLEEFGASARYIFLDERLGSLLARVFYGGGSFEEALRRWVAEHDEVSEAAQKYLAGTLSMQSLSGERHEVPGSAIALALCRASRVSFGIAPSYDATFAYISEILEHAVLEDAAAIRLDQKLIERALPLVQSIESSHRLVGLAEPATFSYLDRSPRENEVAIPPTLRAPRPYRGDALAPGIFVTVTGIPGLERLYEEARSLGLTLYSNEPDRVPGSTYASPDAIGAASIALHFARSGWGSVWGSMLLDKAVVVPEYDPQDDPEILFNNRCLESLRLGVVYRSDPLAEVLEKARALEPGIHDRNAALLARFGTLDGNRFMALRIADDIT